MLNLVFPALPYSRTVDPMWRQEHEEAERRGYAVGLFDEEQNKFYGAGRAAYPALYRGWMLDEATYARLAAQVPLLVSYEVYAASHLATGWYEATRPYTPASVFCRASEAPEHLAAVPKHHFVKTLTKSFGPDSVVESAQQLADVLRRHEIAETEMLMVREYVALSAARPEQRFFCVRGEVFGAAAAPFPAELLPALEKLESRWFYTVDVAYTSEGQPIIIEIGDGQVSDLKEWTVAELYGTAIRRLAELTSEAS